MALNHAELFEKALRDTASSPPRKVRLRSPFEAFRYWAMITLGTPLFLLLGISFVHEYLFPVLASLLGTPTQARVMNLSFTSNKNTNYHYFVQVEYLEPLKKAQGNIEISPSAYSSIRKGQKIGIHYLPISPGVPSLDMSPPINLFYTLIIMVPIFFWAPTWFISGTIRQKRLLTIGKVAKGSVDDNYRGHAVRGIRNISMLFEFEGKIYTARAPRNYYGSCRNGEFGVVMFDPDNPRKNMVYDPSHCIWVPGDN